jgi:DNA-binding CsgD family transcriptional regulator
LADIVKAAREPSTDPLPWLVLEQLKELLHAEWLTFIGLDSRLPRIVFDQSIGPCGERESGSETVAEARENPFWHRYWDPERGCSYADRTGDYTFIRRSSDYESERQRRAWHGQDGEFSQRLIQMCLPVGSPGRYCRVTGFRDGSDFTERDLFYLTLLQPHIERLHRAAIASSRPQLPLSSRQLEVLRLVQAGLTNRQIAHRTGVSEGTVHNHLTHIYTRLGVQSRTAAIDTVFNRDNWSTDNP